MGQIEVTALALKAASALETGSQIITYEQTGDATRTPLFQAIAEGNSRNGCICVKEAVLTILAADVLTSNTTPVSLGITVPSGFTVQVLNTRFKLDYGTTPYATNVLSGIRRGVSGDDVVYFGNMLVNSADTDYTFLPSTNAMMTPSADLEFYTLTGDPTAGDSDITLYVTYRFTTL